MTSSPDDPSRAVVEDLIESIKSKQLQQAQRQSDRKIVEIINRVLGRTIELVYDEDELDKRAENNDERKRMTEETPNIPVITEEDDKTTISPRGPDISRADLNMSEGLGNYDNDLDDTENMATDKRTIGTSMENEESEDIDMSRDPLYRHYLLGISNEDILNVRGTHLEVSTPVHAKNQALPARPSTSDDKSIHHFCIEMLDESDALPSGIRSLTQLYHQRARFRQKLPSTSHYYQHGQLPTYSNNTEYPSKKHGPSM